jgi:hypothetical protein
MKLSERVKNLLRTLYAVCRDILRPQDEVRAANQALKREEIQERERLKAVRKLDGLRNRPPDS